MDKKLLFIVNPRAGRTKSFAPLFDAVACFSKAGYLVKVFLTEGRGDATRAAAELGGAYDLVACAGGDGTFNEMVSGLMQLPEGPEVVYPPTGSTNDFAASLHIPATPLKAAESIVNGRPFYLDVGRHNDRYFAYVASFGAFTRSSYSVPQATKNARLYSGGHEGSGLPAALPLPGGDGRGDLRGGVHLRSCVQLHLSGRHHEAGPQPGADGRRSL